MCLLKSRVSVLFFLIVGSAAYGEKQWQHDEKLDAVIAAPDSHKVLLENDRVRVLRVVIEAGVKEPVHTHRADSVMIVDEPARIKYYGERGELVFETRATDGKSHQEPQWLVPEGPHSVENVDSKPYRAFRIELKN